MNINAINKDVRLIGTVLQLFNSVGNEKTMRTTALSSAKVMAKWDITSLNGRKTYITRKDGSKMRVCIFNGKKTADRTVGFLWLHGGGYALGSPEMAKMSFAKHLIKNSVTEQIKSAVTRLLQEQKISRDCPRRSLLWEL